MFFSSLGMYLCCCYVHTEMVITQEPEIIFENDTLFYATNRLIQLSLSEGVQIEDVRLTTYEIKTVEERSYVKTNGKRAYFSVVNLLVNKKSPQVKLRMGKEGDISTLFMEAEFLKKIKKEVAIKNLVSKKTDIKMIVQSKIYHEVDDEDLKIFWINVLSDTFCDELINSNDSYEIRETINNHIKDSLDDVKEYVINFVNEEFIREFYRIFKNKSQNTSFPEKIKDMFADKESYLINRGEANTKHHECTNANGVRISYQDNTRFISIDSIETFFTKEYQNFFTTDASQSDKIYVVSIINRCTNIWWLQKYYISRRLSEDIKTLESKYVFFKALETATTTAEVKKLYNKYSDYTNFMNSQELIDLMNQIYEKSENIRKALLKVDRGINTFNIIDQKNVAFKLTLFYKNNIGEIHSLDTKYYTVEESSLKLIEEAPITQTEYIQSAISESKTFPFGFWVIISLFRLIWVGRGIMIIWSGYRTHRTN